MSLMIDVAKVTSVLLADGWHEVSQESFSMDSYEFIERYEDEIEPRNKRNFVVLHGGGNSGVCATGFVFKDEYGYFFSGPLAAILAVRYS